MSLLAELEELQRCLEGTAGSDSEEADNHAVPATDFKISEKAVKSSCKNENKNEGTGSVKDTASSCLLLAQPVCKNLSNASATEKSVANSGHSAAKSTAQVSKLQTSTLQSSASKRLVSKTSGNRVNVTSTHTVMVKNVSPDSGMLLTNVCKNSAGVKVCDAKTITDTSAKKDCPSKHFKIPRLKQDELKVPSSKPQDVKVLTCKMSSTSGVNEGLINNALHSASAEKVEKVSGVPESKPALAGEKVSSHKLLELKDKNYVNSSPLQTTGKPLELKVNVDQPKVVARQAQFIVPAKGKLVKVKLPSSAMKTHASDCGLLFVSKSKSESSALGQPSCSTLKRPILYLKKTLGTKSSLHSNHHTGGSETVGRVQPAPGRSVFSLDSKMPRLEEVKIANNRPVVRILNASADSDKNKSATAEASVSSASLFVVTKGSASKERGSANISPVIMKRKRSFEIGPAVGHGPREECPPVSHDTSKHVKPEELKIINAEPNIKRKKVLTDAASVSSSTATLQEVPKDKVLPMSVEIVKKEHEEWTALEMSERAVEQTLLDGSINERNFFVNSELGLVKSARLHQDSEEKHAPEVRTMLGLEKGIVKASKPEAVTRTADTPLVRKRRALSDTLVCGDRSRSEGCVVSQDKRRKLSASEVSGLAEGTMKSETVVETEGSIKMARSPPTRRVPITSTMEVTISPHGVEQNVQTLPVCKAEQCEVNCDLEMEKDDPAKEFMQAKVVLKKLSMPVPGCLLSPSAQVKTVAKIKPQSLQGTLENVAAALQATLAESSVGNQKLLELKKLQDELVEPVKKQKIVKREVLQQKVPGKPPKQKIVGKQAQQKIVRKQTQQKTAGKQSQQKIVRKLPAQKIIGRQSKQKIVGKQTQHKIIGKQTQQRSMGKQNKQTIIGKQSQKFLGKQTSQKIIRKQSEQKIMKKLSQQKVIGRPSQHKYMGNPQLKVAGKSSQQKVIGRANPQKITSKPMQQQKTLSKPKSIQKTSPRNLPSIAIRIASKKKKKETPKKVVSSGNKTKPQKMEPSIIAKKTIKEVSFGNLKHKQIMKSAINQGLEAEKRIITTKEKNITFNKSKENKSDRQEEKMVPPKNEKMTSEGKKKDKEPLEMKNIQSAMKTAKTVQQEKPVAIKSLPGPKRIVSDDKRMKKAQGILIESSEPDGCNTAADDEWIVEVLLDDSEIDMMTVSSQVQVGQDTHSSSVSSSDDKPKDSHVSTSNLDGSHLLECDSSTDLNRRSEAVGGGGEVRRNISASKSNPCRTAMNRNIKQKVASPSVKQVTSSVNNAKRAGFSAEQKMAEMRKAIGDLERIADRSMLRLKAEERQVSLLTNKLHQYENDRHYNMLSKILKDAAPGPKQNPHAEFILDLLLSYCPEDDDSVSS
jgi:hypothetical protein